MIRRLMNQYVMPAWNQFYLDLGSGPEDTVFIAGTERSGTTWLAECINFRRDFRFLFEPFWPEKVTDAGPLKPQTYIRPGEGNELQIDAASRILSGKIRNRWVDKYHRCFLARRRLVKDVRANLYLKWLSDEFPEMAVILLIRHPCAVAKSQIARRHGFGTVEETFLSQPALVEDYLEPFGDDIRHEHSPFEDRIFRWCIQNYVPLDQFSGRNLLVIFYEELCTSPEREFAKIFKHIGIEYDAAILDAAARPSPMSRADSPVNTGADLVDSWRPSLSSSDISSAVDILTRFGLDKLYCSDSMPMPEGLEHFRRR